MPDTPLNQQQKTDEEHLKLLSIFHYVVAGMTALCSCFPIFHFVLGLVMYFAPEQFGNNPPPRFVSFFFTAIPAMIMLLGWTVAVLVLCGGRCLARRKYYTFCFVVACIECVVMMPFGTVLGVFTIIVLVRPSVKELFQASVPPGVK